MLLTESIFWTGFIFMFCFAKVISISWLQGLWPGGRAGGMMMTTPRSVKSVITDDAWMAPAGRDKGHRQ
ncbi:MAG TPA: hypothetical protein DCP05_00435 [Rhodospirillaceae bacterium]|jgi:hypothetical protein|nr:hypothetical protein [Rhodospirillaceae bacterium]|tara:strand:+ start:860 stop:1066 length:207 start_codon:yes stop_codon:yes gene_type:complete